LRQTSRKREWSIRLLHSPVIAQVFGRISQALSSDDVERLKEEHGLDYTNSELPDGIAPLKMCQLVSESRALLFRIEIGCESFGNADLHAAQRNGCRA
jgi:hypothetical protein